MKKPAIHSDTENWLMVSPLWKIWKSVGMIKFPIYGKIKHVPNHQWENHSGPLFLTMFVSNSMKSGPFSMALKRGALLGVQLDKVVLLDFAFFPLRRRGVFIDGFHGISPLRRTKHHLKTDLMGFRVQRRIYWFKGVQWSLVLMYTNLMVIWWIIGQ